jgi:ACS family tartrate transporter-like MFS transporter
VGYLLTIPYLAGLVAMILVGRSSDRRMERRHHTAISLIVGGSAFVALGGMHSAVVTMILLTFLTIGYCSSLPPFWAMPGESLTGFSAASGIALVNSVGNLGGFAGPYVVGFIREKTGTLYGGASFAGCFMLVSAALAWLLPKSARAAEPAPAPVSSLR